ncbi:hypothetical protein JCM11251_005393 [Rhodosporidiobolus azoricus]
MFSQGANSESEDEGCYVFWETKSILAPVSGSSDGLNRGSRSDAPSPSFGSTSHGTPKAKRTTSFASLPSPSGSTTSTARPLRLRKKRKALRRGSGAPEASSQPLDAHTLRMVSQLAMKVNARAAGLISPVVTRGEEAAVTPSAAGKGKGKELDVATEEKPARVALRPVTNGSNTPLRSPPARSPQTLLTLSTTSTKSSLSKSSLSSSATKPPLPPPPLPPLHRQTSASTVDEEDEDSYFEEGDSFDFALSQLDESVITASPPVEVKSETKITPAPKPAISAAPRQSAARLRPIAPIRSSPRLARQLTKVNGDAHPPGPVGLPRTSFCPTRAAPPSRTVTTTPALRPAPPRAPSTRHSATPSSSQSGSNVRTRGTLSAAKQREMEELARKEVEALEALGGAGEWSDEDF